MAFAVTAVAAAIEVTTVASVLSAISAVGLASTVVGVVTGKPNLIKIGGELGLVGGIGGLVNGAINSTGSLAGVADGAADAASESFVQSQGADAAGSLSSAADAAKSAATDSAGGFASGASDAMTSTANTSGVVDSVVTPKSTGILDLSKQTSLSQPSIASADFGGAGASRVGTDIATGTNGMYTGNPTPLADSLNQYMPKGASAYTLNANDVAAMNSAPGATQSTLQTIKDKIGDMWDGLSPQEKAEWLKQGMAIPGGIQSQLNNKRANDINQQRVNQSSYGSAVPTFGIIAKAQKGG